MNPKKGKAAFLDYRHVIALMLSALFSITSSANSEVTETQIVNLSLHSSGVATLVITDQFTACTGAGDTLTFAYTEGTMSEHYYALLLTARAAGIPISIEYSYNSTTSQCVLNALRLANY